MPVCPVDLAVCERAACRDGTCKMADAPPLLLCWECGALEPGRRTVVCVACLGSYAADTTTEER